MSDLIQSIEDVIGELVAFEKSVNKLKTVSVSRAVQRGEVKTLHKAWLPLSGRLEQERIVDQFAVEQANENWSKLRRLADVKSPRKSYKAILRTLIADLETSVL